MRSPWFLTLLLFGACRGNFDAQPDAAVDGPEPVPLPALVCARRSTPATTVTGADLAVASRDDGYVAAWIDPATAAVQVMTFDRGRVATGDRRVMATGSTRLAGLEPRPERIWMVASSATNQTLWSLANDLSAASSVLTEDTVSGFEPIGTGQIGSTLPIWIRGARDTAALRLSYLTTGGEVGAVNTFVTGGKVTALSATDYVDHVHLAWREDSGRCVGTDVDFEAAPTVTGPSLITEDCTDLRIVSGPPPHDPLVTAWTNVAGEVRIKYVGGSIPSGGTEFLATVGNGTAPKITFDGEAYWIAWWKDGAVQLARVDSQGQVSHSMVPSSQGYLPVSEGAFELVRRGISVDLVILSSDALTFLALCAP